MPAPVPAAVGRRFTIRRTPLLAPLFLLFGASAANSYAAIEDDTLRVRFGGFCDNSFPLSEVESVRHRSWPWIFGLGWRTNFRGLVGLVGSYGSVVEVRFRRRQRMRGVLPFVSLSCDRLAVSLEEPQAFLEAVEHGGGAETP